MEFVPAWIGRQAQAHVDIHMEEMKNIKNILIFGLFFLLFACKSETYVASSEKKILEEYTMMTGETEVKIWIDKYIIVGIIHDNTTYIDSLSEVLNELKLEWDTSSVIRTNIGIPISPSSFTFIKRTDDKPISQENSSELEKLRAKYSSNIGPGIYYETGKVWGVLSNSLTVYFERGTNEERISEILNSSKAIKYIQVRENQYHVVFPKNWGYKVIDVGKQLFELEEVRAVENQFRAIKTFN